MWKICCSGVGNPDNTVRSRYIAAFYMNWGFSHCNFSLNLPMTWNDAQCLTKYRRGALLFSNVIHQISRSQGTKQFWRQLRVSGLYLQFEFADGFEMMHTAWRSIEGVPYCHSKSSVNIQGDTGWKIHDLNPIRVRLLGLSQLSNPRDLPCFLCCMYMYTTQIFANHFHFK